MKFEQMINQVIQGDCLEVMKDIPDNSIDLILTDPPYGINMASNGVVGFGEVGKNKKAKLKNYGIRKWDTEIPSKEYFDEIFRISKNQIIFGGNYFVEYLKNSPCWLVWDKDNTGNFADCELCWTSFKTSVKKYKYTWNGMLQENMKQKEVRQHPTQKPVELIRRILVDYSDEGELICDPFGGSGTTARACKDLNRKYILIEKEPDYVKICNQRLAQNNLF